MRKFHPIYKYSVLYSSKYIHLTKLQIDYFIHIQKRLEDLHKKQVKAYLEAAKKALEEWAVATIPLQPMEDTDTKESFVQRCIATLVKPQIPPPNWKGGILVSKVVSSTIKKRAEETFDKYHPVGNDDDDNDNDDEQQDQQQEQEDEDLGDVEPSEGEAPSSETEGDTEEEMDTAGGPQKPAESTASKTIKNKLNTAKTKRLQKIAARKKGNMAKRKVFLNNNNNNKRGKKNPGSNNNNNNNNNNNTKSG